MGWLKDFVHNPIGTLGSSGQKVVNEVGNATKALDQTVRTLPGGWTTAGLLTAGYVYDPALGGYISPDGTAMAAAADVAAADAAAAPVTPGAGSLLGSTGGEASSYYDNWFGTPSASTTIPASSVATDVAPLQTGTAFTGELPAQAAYTAPAVTTLGNVAGTTEGLTSGTALGNAAQGLTATPGVGTDLVSSAGNLADMGGAQGLGAGTTLANLADMGGAQGLTTAAAGLGAGTLLNAAGTGAALTPAAAGIGAGLGTSLAGLDTGAAAAGLGSAAGGSVGNAAANTITGSTLGDILGLNAVSGLLGGYLQSSSAKDAAQIQADAAAKALAQQQANFNTINAQQAPYRAAGYGALNKLANLGSGQTRQYDENGNPIGATTGASDYLTHQFNAQDLKAGLAPNYDFMLQQGQMANQRAANAAGGGLSGNALQGLQKYTQDYAGNAYQNAFNNYQTQRQNIYNTLAGIAGIGQTGQTAANTAGTNLANAASQLGVGSAAAQAAGQTGAANAYTNAINQGVQNYTLASLLNQRGNVQLPTI
jgi:hypothetical protein